LFLATLNVAQNLFAADGDLFREPRSADVCYTDALISAAEESTIVPEKLSPCRKRRGIMAPAVEREAPATP